MKCRGEGKSIISAGGGVSGQLLHIRRHLSAKVRERLFEKCLQEIFLPQESCLIVNIHVTQQPLYLSVLQLKLEVLLDPLYSVEKVLSIL
jgi:hypothetical protein